MIMHRQNAYRPLIRLGVIGTVLVVLSESAFSHAGSHNYGPYPANYSEECGSCHVPYPAQRMTQAGWEIQMRHLKQHYGTDASLDDTTSQAIRSYLFSNASLKEKNAPSENTARLTRTRGFIKEHGSVPPKGGSFSNCNACHTQAEQGDYNKHMIKAPAGWHRAD